MEIKKFNTALISTVIMLLIVAILVLIKVLFSGSKGFEWGSVSDWFSTAGTLGTVLIAWMAYRNAPEWISQKNDEHVNSLVIELIYSDLQKIRELSFSYKSNLYGYFNMARAYIANPKLNSEDIDARKDSLDSLHEELTNYIFFVIRKSKTVSRYRWELTDEAKSIFNDLKEYVPSYNKIHEELFEIDSKYRFADEYSNILKLCTTTQIEIQSLDRSITKLIRELESENNDVEYFIKRRKRMIKKRN